MLFLVFPIKFGDIMNKTKEFSISFVNCRLNVFVANVAIGKQNLKRFQDAIRAKHKHELNRK